MKINDIRSYEFLDAISEHGRNDVSIVNLFTTYRDRTYEVEQSLSDGTGLISDVEVLFEILQALDDKSHGLTCEQNRVVDFFRGIFEAGGDVFGFKEREIFQNLNVLRTGGQQFQYVTHANSRAADTRSTAALVGIKCNSEAHRARLGWSLQQVKVVFNQVTNEWNWDAPGATGQLEYVTNGQFQESYSYQSSDAKLSSVSTSVNVAGVLTQNYSRSFGYDTAGRLATISYPNMVVGHEYSSLGYLVRYRHVNSGNVLDEVTDTDAYSNVTEQRFWNAGLRTSRGYAATSEHLTSIQSGAGGPPKSIRSLSYIVYRSTKLLRYKANSPITRRLPE